MNAFIRRCVELRKTTITLLLFGFLAGLWAYINIAKEEMPDIEMPLINISLNYTGTSPEESENLLIKPLERELSGITDLDTMTASARQNGGNIQLQFEPNTDMSARMDDVKDAISRARSSLPTDMDEPQAKEASMEDSRPVLSIMLSGLSEYGLLQTARSLKEDLESLPGVLSTDVIGERSEEVQLLIDPVKLETYNLDLASLMQQVNAQNRLVAPGTITPEKGRFALNINGKIDGIAQLMNTPIIIQGNQMMRVQDIVDANITLTRRNSAARLNGESVISLNVKKKSGENIIETLQSVRHTTDQLATQVPGLKVTYINDSSEKIDEMLYDLNNNILTSVVIVCLLLIMFLGLRPALLVGISIPASFVIGILWLYIQGITLNTIVLFALVMVVGMLVDAAIVVTERAQARITQGLSRTEAFIEAGQQMFMPVMSSTLTTLCAFLPLLFWPGQVGDFMRYLPLTVITVLTAAFIVSVFLLPALGAAIGRNRLSTPSSDTNPGVLMQQYIRVLKACLRYPKTVLFTAVWLCVGLIFAYSNSNPRIEFFPDTESNIIYVDLMTKGDLSLEERDHLVREVEADLTPFYDEVESIYTQVRGFSERFGRLTLNLTDWSLRRESEQIMNALRQHLTEREGVKIFISRPKSGPGGNSSELSLEVSAVNKTTLYRGIEALKRELSTLPELSEVETSIRTNGIEWNYRIDRDAMSAYGVGLDVLSAYIQLFSNGIKLVDFTLPNSAELVDVRLFVPESDRTLTGMESIWINTAQGQMPLNHFIHAEPKPRIGYIRRVDEKERLSLSASIQTGLNVNDIRERVLAAYKTVNAEYPGLHIKFTGNQESQAESIQFLSKAFVVAIALMFLVLLIQFNSLIQPVYVLSAIVFSSVGVITLLWITGLPFGVVMGGIGVIALAGIVVNTNIVLIDTYNHFVRREGYGVHEAIVRTCEDRFRPIILTTLTTILGLLPMALKINMDFLTGHITFNPPSSMMWYQLALSIVGGLSFAFIVTLIVTPCLLILGSKKEKVSC